MEELNNQACETRKSPGDAGLRVDFDQNVVGRVNVNLKRRNWKKVRNCVKMFKQVPDKRKLRFLKKSVKLKGDQLECQQSFTNYSYFVI